jgi:2-amino-4-hydroxy-6-hydroxymethyldihydropteridine diphosphokinase
MTEIFISIGSNIDRERHIQSGVHALEDHFGPGRYSPVYESEAVGFDGDNFINLVVAFDTDQPVQTVNQILSEIENQHQRDRNAPRFSSRTLDLDLLLFDDLQITEGKLVLPRPDILTNAFVLKPLADLAPEKSDPASNLSYLELWQRFDQASQPLWEIEFDLFNRHSKVQA